nr:McrC family protein [Cupriavidus basilensis]
MDRAQISTTAFDWLCKLNASFSAKGAAIVQIEGRRWLKLDNHVGVLETPCGTRLEILPKHFEQGDCVMQSRQLLCRMICTAFDLPRRDAGQADLERFDLPINEWVMMRFLQALDQLTKRGMRFDYQRVEEEQRYLRGQLDIAKQMRLPPGRQHYFQLRHDVFLPDRPENRLLRLALERIVQGTLDPDNWRLANELRGLLHDVPFSTDIEQDFRLWRSDRLMAHYQAVKPWCEMILHNQLPMAVSGEWRGTSLLFPMEMLFELYVEACLRRVLPKGAKLIRQPAREYLCRHDDGMMFRLKPDLLLEHEGQRWILDTKWKRLDSADKRGKYGLSQADFYQMHAYGHRYFDDGSRADMLLIFPRKPSFLEALPEFVYSERMRLWVVPFDLEDGLLRVAGLHDRQELPAVFGQMYPV